SHSSIGIRSNAARDIGMVAKIAALLTRMSILPHASIARCAIARQLASSETSVCTASASWPSVFSSAATTSPALASISATSLDYARTMKEKSHRTSPRCYRCGVETYLGTHTRRLDGYSLYTADHV